MKLALIIQEKHIENRKKKRQIAIVGIILRIIRMELTRSFCKGMGVSLSLSIYIKA